jgi:hypothetical protein
MSAQVVDLPSPFSPQGLQTSVESVQRSGGGGGGGGGGGSRDVEVMVYTPACSSDDRVAIYADFTTTQLDYTVASPENRWLGQPLLSPGDMPAKQLVFSSSSSPQRTAAAGASASPEHAVSPRRRPTRAKGSPVRSAVPSAGVGVGETPDAARQATGTAARTSPRAATAAGTPVATLHLPDPRCDDTCDRLLDEDGVAQLLDEATLRRLPLTQLEQLADFMSGCVVHQSNRLISLLQRREDLKERVREGQQIAAEHIRLQVQQRSRSRSRSRAKSK